MVGEHIRASRGGRWEHGIDCGDETVIHLADTTPGPAHVRRSYRPDFVSGSESVEVVAHRERTFEASEVVARAFRGLADPPLAAMFKDSGAFAEWCATGRLPQGITAAAAIAVEAAAGGETETRTPVVTRGSAEAKAPERARESRAAKKRHTSTPKRRAGSKSRGRAATPRKGKSKGKKKVAGRASRPTRRRRR